MQKVFIAVGVIAAAILIIVIGFVSTIVGTLNGEAFAKNQIEAQVEVREAYYDKMWKVIKQKTQITKASTEVQKQLVESLVKGRGATFINALKEANPESAFTREQFTDLSNSVEAQREGFFREQKELIGMYQQYENRYDSLVGGTILSIAGREKMDRPVVISSSATKDIVESGIEDDVDLEL